MVASSFIQLNFTALLLCHLVSFLHTFVGGSSKIIECRMIWGGCSYDSF